MALEWKDGGSEPLMWAKNGRGGWCATWAQGDNFAAWVSKRSGSQTSVHPTDAEARTWCEARLADDDPPPFVCPICQRASWHPRDAEQRFCGVCGFVDDNPGEAADG